MSLSSASLVTWYTHSRAFDKKLGCLFRPPVLGSERPVFDVSKHAHRVSRDFLTVVIEMWWFMAMSRRLRPSAR